MDRRPAALVLLCALLLVWGGYSAYVFNLEAVQPNQQTIVMTSDVAAPGESASAHVVVTDRATGRPLADTNVTLTLTNGSRRETVASGATNANGSYTEQFPVPNETGSYDLQVEADTPLGTDEATTDFRVQRAYSVVVDTDKPVYQPGQSIHIRSLVRSQGGSPATGSARAVVKGPKGNTLFSRNVSLNDYGMGSVSFPVASEGHTGRYRVTVSYGDAEQTRTVSVKRYETPRFDVGFRPNERYYKPGETVSATVDAAYFFGEPVANATVRVTGAGYVGSMSEFGVTTARTDETGVATVSLALPEYFAGTPRTDGRGVAVFNVSVTDPAGHTETVRRRVPVAESDLLLKAFPAGGTVVPGVENTVYVVATYPDGRPARATVTIGGETGTEATGERDSEATGGTDGETTSETADATTLETNRYGVAEYEFVPEGDPRRLHLRARAGAATVETTAYFEAPNGTELALQVDRGAYRVGDTLSGRVLVGESAGPVYLDVVAGHRTLRTETLRVTDGTAGFGVDLPPAARGNVRVRAWAVFENNRVGATVRRVPVRPADDLAVNVSAGQAVYRPGEPATLTVETRRGGSPVPASVGLDVVDESVFAVEEDRAGLAAAHFEIERNLLEPELFVHNYSVAELQKPPADDGEKLAQSVAAAQLPADTGGSAVNSFDRKLRRINRRQANHRRLNGRLVAGLLLALPVGVLGVGLRRRRTEFLADLGASLGLAIAGVVVGSALLVGLFVFDTLVSSVGVISGLSLYLAVLAILPVVLVLLGVLLWRTGESALRVPLGGGFVAYVCLVVGTLLARPYVSHEPVKSLAPILAGAFLLFGLTWAAIGHPRLSREHAFKGLALGMALSLVLLPIPFVIGLGDQVASTAPRGLGDEVGTGGANGGVGGAGTGGTGGSAGATESLQVRQFFPETLASRTVVTGPDGRATVDLRMADSITTWRVGALASTRNGAVGSSRSSVRVFQPFFIKPDVPVQLTANDTVTIPVSVFNYGNVTRTVTLRLRNASWFRARNTTATVSVPSQSVRAATFTITARQHGEQPLAFVAKGRDAVRKEVTVEPAGRRRVETRSGPVDGRERVNVTVPRAAVKNGSTAVLRVYPGAFGQVVAGIEGLLRMPTGCFEQTSSSLYPDVLALQYMERTGKTNPEFRMTADRFITTGYQRLLTFETSTPGGYSLFGNDPPNLLLTAYGLQQLSDMSRVHSVDPTVIREMQGFIANRQRSDGSWPTDGELEYTLGVSGNRLSTTAYVTWSLAHSVATDEGDVESRSATRAVDRGTDYLKRTLDVASADTMTLAVALNALVDAEAHPALRQRIADELEARATVESDTAHWSRGSKGSKGSPGSPGDGTDGADGGERYRYGDKPVLTTATATNALVKGGYKPGVTTRSLTWLVEQKRGHGWGSTQNTVMALKALVHASDGTGASADGRLTVRRNGRTVAQRDLSGERGDEVQTVELPATGGSQTYEIAAPEADGLYYELTTEYYIPWPGGDETGSDETGSDETGGDETGGDETDAGDTGDGPNGEPSTDGGIGLEVRYDRTALTVDDTLGVHATVRSGQGTIGMALVDLGVPPGFTVVESSLERLRERGVISRYDVRGRQILLYVEDLQGTRRIAFDLRATQPVEASSGASRIYDYYNPDMEAVEAPVSIHVRGDAD